MVGNLCAICASAVMAIYSAYSDSILRDCSLCPFYIYLAMMSCIIACVSYGLSIYMGSPVHLFSMDPATGLFGVFATK